MQGCRSSKYVSTTGQLSTYTDADVTQLRYTVSRLHSTLAILHCTFCTEIKWRRVPGSPPAFPYGYKGHQLLHVRGGEPGYEANGVILFPFTVPFTLAL